jgi:hypothetical protein
MSQNLGGARTDGALEQNAFWALLGLLGTSSVLELLSPLRMLIQIHPSDQTIPSDHPTEGPRSLGGWGRIAYPGYLRWTIRPQAGRVLTPSNLKGRQADGTHNRPAGRGTTGTETRAINESRPCGSLEEKAGHIPNLSARAVLCR